MFKSLKTAFSQQCQAYTAEKPGSTVAKKDTAAVALAGRNVTIDVLPSLLEKTWSLSHTPVNILSGFYKINVEFIHGTLSK